MFEPGKRWKWWHGPHSRGLSLGRRSDPPARAAHIEGFGLEIKELQHNWDALGKADPLWAILSDPKKKYGRWDEAEFFQSGEAQIDHAMGQLQALGIDVARRRCLDFGCGVGRLTQALCRYFDQSCGVDIAASMIEQAERYNRYPDRCRYYLNTKDDLALFDDDSFDFIYSVIVLQHMRPEYSKRYIGEFVRILRPQGIAVFQLPSEPVSVIERFSLPRSGFKAEIRLAGPFSSIQPGERATIDVKVKNLSDTTWIANFHTNGTCQIRLGNHWLDRDGRVVIHDDGRSFLPKDLKPAEEALVPLTITGPEQPGAYLLEIDLVQELVSWFKDQGSATLRVPVRSAFGVGARIRRRLFGAPRKALPPPEKDAPVMEMHTVPRSEVLELVRQVGGKIVDAQEDLYCGTMWRSYTYFVTKEPA